MGLTKKLLSRGWSGVNEEARLKEKFGERSCGGELEAESPVGEEHHGEVVAMLVTCGGHGQPVRDRCGFCQ